MRGEGKAKMEQCKTKEEIIEYVCEQLMEIRNSGDKEKAIDIVETLLLKEGIPVNCIQTDRDDNYIYAEYELSLNEEKAICALICQ